MAGHSHSKNVRDKKNKTDALKSKTFTKINREIIAALKIGGPDETKNPKLYHVIRKAKTLNVPKHVIQNAMEKFLSKKSEGEERFYEGFGPHKSAFIVECSTDNVNRTFSEIKKFFNRISGNISNTMYLFRKIGRMNIQGVNEDTCFNILMDHPDIENISSIDNSVEILCGYKALNNVANVLNEFNPEYDIVYKSFEQISISEEEKQELLTYIQELFENSPDVVNIYSNISTMELIKNSMEE